MRKVFIELAKWTLTQLGLKGFVRQVLQSDAVKKFTQKKIFSINNCLLYDNNTRDRKCLGVLGEYLSKKTPNLAFYGAGKLCRYILKQAPELRSAVKFIVEDKLNLQGGGLEGIPIIAPSNLPDYIDTVFLCTTRSRSIANMKKKMCAETEIITLDIVEKIDKRAIPKRAWRPEIKNIYPIDIPDITFLPNMDIILLDLPARNLAMLPNGLSYVHNILKKTGIRFQTVDLDIIIYHRFHSQRILDCPDQISTPSGYVIDDDPWNMITSSEGEWEKPELIEYFRPEIKEIIDSLIKARPKIIGISLHQSNLVIAQEIVNGVRENQPDIIIIVGGFSCVHHTVGRRVFPECDYMVMGEAELTLGPLVKALVAGKKPFDLPGILSRYDSPDRIWTPSPLLHDLNSIDFPRYDWADLNLYRNFDGYHLTPIVTTRGCRWSRCTFCAERFLWRKRLPQKVADELEWLTDHGRNLFMFNESDLNGDPATLLAICDEIISRKLKITLTGQLRIHKNSTLDFFDRLFKAGFRSLRFGVDGWSKNTLRLQKKGYTKNMISQNLRDCYKAGIYVETNVIIGVPGETDDDVKETIDFIFENKDCIGNMATLRMFMLMVGSDCYEDPERYNICFRGDKNEIYDKYNLLIPNNAWYSVDPYIDHEVRLNRLKRIYDSLIKNDIHIGDVAKFRAEQSLENI